MNPAPNLVLVGPMGAGKTSLGRSLARRLGLAFVDADARLEEQVGASVAMIFELEGEAGFRQREERLLCELLRGERQLIATGGGAVLSATTREAMRTRAFVVWLRVDIDQQLARLARDHTRPLLAQGDRRQTLDALVRHIESLPQPFGARIEGRIMRRGGAAEPLLVGSVPYGDLVAFRDVEGAAKLERVWKPKATVPPAATWPPSSSARPRFTRRRGAETGAARARSANNTSSTSTRRSKTSKRASDNAAEQR